MKDVEPEMQQVLWSPNGINTNIKKPFPAICIANFPRTKDKKLHLKNQFVTPLPLPVADFSWNSIEHINQREKTEQLQHWVFLSTSKKDPALYAVLL